MSFVTTSVVLAAQVANAGTVTVPYPAGTNQAFFTGANAAANSGAAVINENDVYPEAGSGVRINLTYGGSDITLTNNTGVTWPAGSIVRVQLGRAGIDRPGFQRAAGAIVPLTDSSGGTASDTIAAIGATYTQAEVRNAVASLAAKINELAVQVRALGGLQ